MPGEFRFSSDIVFYSSFVTATMWPLIAFTVLRLALLTVEETVCIL